MIKMCKNYISTTFCFTTHHPFWCLSWNGLIICSSSFSNSKASFRNSSMFYPGVFNRSKSWNKKNCNSYWAMKDNRKK